METLYGWGVFPIIAGIEARVGWDRGRGDWFVVVPIGALAVGSLVAFILWAVKGWPLYHNRCPKCSTNYSWSKTGKRKGRGPWGMMAGIREMECKSCGHTEWEDEPTGGGGA